LIGTNNLSQQLQSISLLMSESASRTKAAVSKGQKHFQQMAVQNSCAVAFSLLNSGSAVRKTNLALKN
jgi:hypothetical protein